MITRAQAFARIRATLKARGFVRSHESATVFNGRVPVHGKPIDVILSVPDPTFVVMPEVCLTDRNQISVQALAHVEANNGNRVCYKSAVGLLLDMYKPGAAILLVLAEVQRTLELSFAGRGSVEMAAEFQLHWPSQRWIGSLLYKRKHPETFDAVWGRFECGEDTFDALVETVTLPPYRGSVIKGVVVVPADAPLKVFGGGSAPETLDELKSWIEQQPGLSHLPWSRCIRTFASGKDIFIWADNAFIGFSVRIPPDLLELKRKAKPKSTTIQNAIMRRADKIAVTRISVTARDLDSVSNRGGAMETTLADKKVALIGCGTIGGYLARMLAQSGAGAGDRGELLLFDTQTLSEHNLGRHLLGIADVGKPKAKAVEVELKRFQPQVKVKGVVGDALQHWKTINGSDLVIDATGDWNTQNAVNAAFLTSPGSIKALLYAWVFMNGSGVQSFIHIAGEFPCFRCLKPEFSGDWRYPAALPETELDMHPANCTDGAFIPFSVDASVMAAAQANKVAMDWAAGRPGKRLRTIKVDLKRGRSQDPTTPTPAANCPACADLRADNG